MSHIRDLRTALIAMATVLAFAISVLTAAPAQASATVPDPSFETDSGWFYYGMTRSTSNAHTGTYSVTTAAVGAATVSGAFDVDPDTSYRLSAWIYKTDGSGTAYLDLNGAAGEPKPQLSEGGRWTRVTGDWFSGSSTSVQIRLLTAAGITGAVYFDDVSLTVNEPDLTFESAAGWDFGPTERTTEQAKSGNYSVKAVASGSAARTNPIPVTPKTYYELSGWIKRPAGSGVAYFDLDDIAGEEQAGLFSSAGTEGEWQRVSTVWYNNENTEVRLRAVADGLTAPVFFDDVALRVVEADGTVETDAGWTHSGTVRSTERAHGGAASLTSSINGATATASAVSIVPNATYRLTGWIFKTTAAGNAYLDLSDLDGEPQPGVWAGEGAGVWTRVSMLWRSGNAPTAQVRAVVDGGVSGAVFFDDIQFALENVDGSFETSDGWSLPGEMARTDADFHSGTNSLRSTTDGAVAVSNQVAVTPNTRYTLSVWMKKTTSPGRALVDLNGVSDQVVASVGSSTSTGAWVQINREWWSGDRTHVELRAKTDGGITGAVYFDDISLTVSTVGVAPDSRIPTTVNPTEDIPVIEFDATSFGADPTGAGDSTSAIQAALDNAAMSGGGTVWLPAGTYAVSRTIEVPAGVSLRGDWRDPSAGTGAYGTVISADVTAGFDALFTLEGDVGGLDGLTIYYPGQKIKAPIDTGWVAVSNSGHNRSISHLTLLNAYKGFRVGGDSTGGYASCPEISFIRGTVLSKGLEMYNGYGAGGAHDIDFGKRYWLEAGSAFGAPTAAALKSFTRSFVTAFTFGRTEIFSFSTLSASDVDTGILFDGGNTAAGQANWGGNFAFVSITKSNTALRSISASSGRFSAFIRSKLEGSSHSVNNSATGHTILITDSKLTGTRSGSVDVRSPGTSPTTLSKSTLPKVTRAVVYDVTDAPYSAPSVSSFSNPAGFPRVDATSAIQAALTTAGNEGGGIVVVPAGWYRISGHLTVPANVELRGVGTGKTGAYISSGTWLTAYEGKGSSTASTDPALVTVAGNNSGISGINVIWPENPFTSGGGSPEAFPFAFRLDGDDNYVVNTNFKNPSFGIDVSNGSDRHVIRAVYGSFSNTFIRVGDSTEGWIEELYDMNPSPWTGLGEFRMSLPWMAPGIFPLDLVNYTRTQHFIELNGPSNEHIRSVLAYAPGTLIYVISGTADIWNVGADQSGAWAVEAPGGSVSVMNSVNTVHGTSVNTGTGVVRSFNEHYVIP